MVAIIIGGVTGGVLFALVMYLVRRWSRYWWDCGTAFAPIRVLVLTNRRDCS